MGRADSTMFVKSSSDACQLHWCWTQAAPIARVVKWGHSLFSIWKEELDEQGVINSSVSESPSLDEDVQLQILQKKTPKQNKIKQKSSKAV